MPMSHYEWTITTEVNLLCPYKFTLVTGHRLPTTNIKTATSLCLPLHKVVLLDFSTQAGILLLGDGGNRTHAVRHTRLDPAFTSANYAEGAAFSICTVVMVAAAGLGFRNVFHKCFRLG